MVISQRKGFVMDNMENVDSKTTVAIDVLYTIVRYTTLGVEGVSRLELIPGSVNRILTGNVVDGVKIIIEKDLVYIDLFVVLNTGINVRDVSHKIQADVTRAIAEMVGMEVARVNIHIEDFHYNAIAEAKI